MKKALILLLSLLLVAAMLVPVFSAEKAKIRIGWQVPWSTQGQLVQIFKNADILKKNGLEAEFIGRTFGPELNEAALAGDLDVVLTAAQPAAVLFSKDKGWIAIGRLMYNRTVTYVPPFSPIKSIADLKGKTVGVPVGAEAEKGLVEAIKRAGLDPKKDVKIVNLAIMEQGALVSRAGKNAVKWDMFDALCGFDLTPAILESQGLARAIDINKVVSLVLMNQKFIDKNPGVAEKLMQSFVDAYDFYRQNEPQANLWFMKEARLKNADQRACEIASLIEPNLDVKSRKEIRVWFNDDDYAIMQGTAKFVAEITKKPEVNMRQLAPNKYAKQAK